MNRLCTSGRVLLKKLSGMNRQGVVGWNEFKCRAWIAAFERSIDDLYCNLAQSAPTAPYRAIVSGAHLYELVSPTATAASGLRPCAAHLSWPNHATPKPVRPTLLVSLPFCLTLEWTIDGDSLPGWCLGPKREVAGREFRTDKRA